MCLDTADWQDCTKASQISTLPQIPFLRGKSEETCWQSEGLKAEQERHLQNKGEGKRGRAQTVTELKKKGQQQILARCLKLIKPACILLQLSAVQVHIG